MTCIAVQCLHWRSEQIGGWAKNPYLLTKCGMIV
jgi:hypothetical protein